MIQDGTDRPPRLTGMRWGPFASSSTMSGPIAWPLSVFAGRWIKENLVTLQGRHLTSPRSRRQYANRFRFDCKLRGKELCKVISSCFGSIVAELAGGQIRRMERVLRSGSDMILTCVITPLTLVMLMILEVYG